MRPLIRLGRSCAQQIQEYYKNHRRFMTKPNPLPSLELLNQLLEYKEETGALIWKVGRGKGHAAGWRRRSHKNKSEYIRVEINQKTYSAHRIAYYMQTKVDPGLMQIDHIDGNGLNNKFSNLRLATAQQNMWNRGVNCTNKSGYKGVCYHKLTGKWMAGITSKNGTRYLGVFMTPELAYMAYCKAAAELHGDFVRAV